MENIPHLTAKINAKNKVNAKARTAWPAYYAAIAPFLGKKIVKADGSFTQAFKSALPQGEAGDYWGRNDYSVSRVFKQSEQIDGQPFCLYEEAYIYFGEVKDGILTQMHDCTLEGLRTDYTLAEVLAKRERVEKAKAELSAAQSACFPFGD